MIVLVFVPMWLIALIPYTIKHLRPEFYAVFVMDLCLVMPAFGIIAVKLLRNKPFGNILAGVALMKALTLCLSVAIGESIGHLYGAATNYPMIAVYIALTAISAAFCILHISKMSA